MLSIVEVAKTPQQIFDRVICIDSGNYPFPSTSLRQAQDKRSGQALREHL